MKRRTFLKGSLAGSAVTLAMGAGLLTPTQVLAAWPKNSFEAKSAEDAIKNVYGGAATPSDKISLKTPDIAENGAVVPVTVKAEGMGKVESISILVEKNATPLSANFKLSDRALPEVSTRIKMGQTSNVIAVVKADGKLFSASKEVKVTIGGCGG